MRDGLDERLKSKDDDVFKKAFKEEVLETYSFLSKKFKGCAPYTFVENLIRIYKPRYDNLSASQPA